MFQRHYVGLYPPAARRLIVRRDAGAMSSFRMASALAAGKYLGMAGLTEDDRSASPSNDAEKISPPAKRRRADHVGQEDQPQIGRALRSVYDETVSEAIPSEMLDLLGKLD